jgi:hypothetical protein
MQDDRFEISSTRKRAIANGSAWRSTTSNGTNACARRTEQCEAAHRGRPCITKSTAFALTWNGTDGISDVAFVAATNMESEGSGVFPTKSECERHREVIATMSVELSPCTVVGSNPGLPNQSSVPAGESWFCFTTRVRKWDGNTCFHAADSCESSRSEADAAGAKGSATCIEKGTAFVFEDDNGVSSFVSLKECSAHAESVDDASRCTAFGAVE